MFNNAEMIAAYFLYIIICNIVLGTRSNGRDGRVFSKLNKREHKITVFA